MKVGFQLDPSCAEPRAVIHASQMTDEIAVLLRRLTETPPAFLMGFREEQAVPLDPSQIIRVYAQAGKVLADTPQGSYVLRHRLCDLETLLATSCIWQVEKWSLLKQTVLHFAVSSLSALPIAWLMCWFLHTWVGCATYFLSFLLLYAGIWSGNYLSVRARVRAMNRRLKQ